jgi:hypothetical protein
MTYTFIVTNKYGNYREYLPIKADFLRDAIVKAKVIAKAQNKILIY